MMHWLTRFPRWTALIAGAASATGFAPLGLWPVTLVALALLLALLEAAPTRRRAFLLGWLWGVGHFTVGNNWIATAFTYQAKMPGWLGWFAVVALALYLAVYPALAALGAWWVSEIPPRMRGGGAREACDGGEILNGKALNGSPPPPAYGWSPSPRAGRNSLPLLFAAAWIITEWLRSWVFTGFAWNPLSATAMQAPEIVLSYVGTYGASAIVVLIAAVLLHVLPRWLFRNKQDDGADSESDTAGDSLFGAVIFGILAMIFFFALMPFLPRHQTDGPQGPRITVVQPNIPQDEKWNEAQRAVNFQKLARLSPRLDFPPGMGDAGPRLLLWPEAAVPDYLEAGYPLYWYDEAPEQARARIASLLSAGDVLLTGAVKLEPTRDGMDVLGARNSVFALAPDGTLGPRYDKSHLVPYGEYLPMRTLLEPLGLSRLAPGALDFWPGPGARTLDLQAQGFGRVGVQICYEIIFSGQVVDRANRPDFLFNPSNDAWFGGWGPPQHLAQARLRAIEEGLPVVRATPTGISAVIDADGRVLRSIPMHRAGRIDMRLPAPHAPTPFARYGNALPLLFAALLIALALVPLARRRTAR